MVTSALALPRSEPDRTHTGQPRLVYSQPFDLFKTLFPERRGLNHPYPAEPRSRSPVPPPSACPRTHLPMGAGISRGGRDFQAWAGIFPDSAKLSLYDSSHLTAIATAGKLEPRTTQLHTHKDCSWHVR